MLDVDSLIRILNLSQKEDLLLKLYVSETVTKDEVYRLLNDFDYSIEKEELSFNFLLAQLFSNNPHIEIPKDIKPRLQGVLRWFQYRNILLLSGLKQLAAALNKNNIPVLFIKGNAMRILDPNKSRVMADVDCFVGVDNFDRAIKISESLGFNVHMAYKYATELKKETMQKIYIHKNFVKSYKDTEKIDKKIFERAKQFDFYDSKVFVPNSEDIVFLLLTNGYDNIICSRDFYKRISWLFDVVYIIKHNKEIDWNLVIFDAKETGILAELKIMFELINKFLPNIVPNNVISSINISKQEDKKFLAYTKKHLFWSKTQQLKEQVRDCVKGNGKFNFSLVIKSTIQFFYLKIIQEIPIVSDNVANRMFKI